MKLGIIKKLEVRIPYTQLSSKPCIARFDEIYLVVQTQEQAEWILRDQCSYEYKVRKVEAYVRRYLNDASLLSKLCK